MRVCQVLPDAKEERPAYFAGLEKIDFSNHRGSEQAPCPVADMHALAVEQCAGENIHARAFVTIAEDVG